MAWQLFGTLAAGNENLSLFDTLAAQIAKTVLVPCTAAGTNVITLTGTTNAPSIPSYSDLVTFSFLAAATATGALSALFTGLATLNVYLADGTTQASAGNTVAGQFYTLTYSLALNGGAGGFYLGRLAVPVGVTSGMQLIQKQTATNSATIDFTNGIGASYGSYVVQLQDIVPATDNSSLFLRVSQDAGATWLAAANYDWIQIVANDGGGNPTTVVGTGASAIQVATGLGNVSTRAFGGEVKFWTPNGTARNKIFMFDCAYGASGVAIRITRGNGQLSGNANAINGVRFLMSAGNITAGTFSLYGMPNA